MRIEWRLDDGLYQRRSGTDGELTIQAAEDESGS